MNSQQPIHSKTDAMPIQENYHAIGSYYQEIEIHLMEDDRPSMYLDQVSQEPWFQQHPFQMLYRLKSTEQSPEHHPEGNVWNHTMLVVDEAAKVRAKSKHPVAFMWAALLHDIGKPSTTKVRKGRITAYDHDQAGEELAKEFLQEFTEDAGFIDEVVKLVKYHMQILYVLKDLPYADISGMLAGTDIEEIALLGLCDRLGRGKSDRNKEYQNIKLFIQKCQSNAKNKH